MMEDFRLKIVDAFRTSLESLEQCSKHSVIVKVSSKWIENLKNGNHTFAPLARAEKTDSRSNSEAPKLSELLQTEVLITVFPCSQCNCQIEKKENLPGKVYGRSFISTFEKIAKANEDGLFKDLVKSNPNYYCPVASSKLDEPSPLPNPQFCHRLLSSIYGRDVVQFWSRENGNDSAFLEKKNHSELGSTQVHANLEKVLTALIDKETVFLISSLKRGTVQDALMYSPAVLRGDDVKTLFVLYQVLHFFSHFEDQFCRDLSSIHWDDVQLDSRAWIKVRLPEDSFLLPGDDQEEQISPVKKTEEKKNKYNLERLPDILDKWACGEISNFDYLMFLNKLAGRSEKDPNHHPLLPWVSSFETEKESWRDLTKSKYRLNKGDHQLDIQYSMMHESANVKDARSWFNTPNLPQVPHHVPEFLSDITYYVYLARRTSKEILCKLVRSYWEPNEYPASIQRMQEWTPDECIPEFYTDPSIFKSIHDDMADLAVPNWCSGPEDFIKKHRSLLESDEVSRNLHQWIDVTFGYKLSGKESVEAKNVCLPLVDNHTKVATRGITQLFDVPHPQKRCKDEGNGPSPQIVDGKLQLPASFNPLKELDELEKLLTFKAKLWNDTDCSLTLLESLEKSRSEVTSRGQQKAIRSDRNVAAFICLMVELYLPLRTRTMTRDLPLAERFKGCIQAYKLYKDQMPPGIKFAMDYFIRNFRNSEEKTFEELGKTANPGDCESYSSIFQTISDRDLPPPTCTVLSSPYVHVLPFPPYFEQLYDVLATILVQTDHYSQPLVEPVLSRVSEMIQDLLRGLHDSTDCLLVLTPHVQQLLRQTTIHAVRFLLINFEMIAKAMGTKRSLEDLFPFVITLYESSLCQKSTNNEDEVSEKNKMKRKSQSEKNMKLCLVDLYGKPFLLQLSTRLGLKPFMENLPRCLSDALLACSNAVNESISETSQESIFWLMGRIGPTLTSKYIVRHLFRVLSLCFTVERNGSSSPEPEEKRHRMVLDCLMHAAQLFGPSIITLQYFAHLIHNISSAFYHPKFASRHQAGVEASVVAVTHFITYLTDSVLMEQLARLSKEIIIPVAELLARTDLSFYGGADARKSLCLKVIHLMALIVIRIGREMSRKHLTHLFQTFFSHFHQSEENSSSGSVHSSTKHYLDRSFDSIDSDAVIIDHDTDTKTFKVGGAVLLENSAGIRRQLHKSWFNDSPTPSPNKGTDILQRTVVEDSTDRRKEISATFCPETAYCSYVSFTRLLGNIHMENILGNNHDNIWKLSTLHEQTLNGGKGATMSSAQPPPIRANYHSDVTMVGNKLIVTPQTPQVETKPALENDLDIMTTLLTSSGGIHTEDQLEGSVRRKLEVFPSSQLTENWLAYWEHEIGLPENDKHIHFNQIELQAFTGHNSTVRCLSCHQSEEWFLSGGKDKTVKIWSLWKNDKTPAKKDPKMSFSTPCFTYKSHRKPVTYVGIVETEQLVVSSDGHVHVWDPFRGCKLFSSFEDSDVKSGFALVSTLPSPHRYALAATSEGILRFIDFRRKIFAHEYKTMFGNSMGIARAICASTDGHWVAIGFSSGTVSITDVRVGTLLSVRQHHEGDISTMTTVSGTRYLSASTDQSVALWEVGRSAPVALYKLYQEPVHTIEKFNDEIISASVANRVTVHALPGHIGEGMYEGKPRFDKPITVSKLRNDSFKGALTSFSVLPMKRQLLLASDNGSIKLMA